VSKINTMTRNSQPQDEKNTLDGNGRSVSESPQSNQAGAAAFIKQLKQRLEETRLPANLKEQILAELPPPEERERLLQELQENGGLSSEEFLTSLDLDAEPKP
jgi:hypothetical protein